MAIGDILNPKRVRTEANERLDVPDVDALSFVAREFLDAYSRAIEAAPRNVGVSTPTGLIVQGFGLTLNPINSTDAKVRVQSPVGVAIDANGRLLIKESGVQVDLTLPSGNSQIYAYYTESVSDTTVRRRISVSSPFTESGASIATKLKSDVAFFTRTGDQTSIVASDVVNGVTTPLCFLGVANNSGGTVTMTGYNATTAPNGAFATNRITSVITPTTLPQATTANGSVTSMHGLVTAVAYMVGQALWKGSAVSPPTTANNFQAWAPHTSSVATLSEYLAAGHLVGNHTISGSLTVGGQALVVPTTTFTADNTTDIFTAAGHNLQLGDGGLRVFTTGTLPTGLALATDYWAMPLTVNTYQLADSLAHALTGVFLAISTNGTGVQTIASTGSTTRATNAAISGTLTQVTQTTVVPHRNAGFDPLAGQLAGVLVPAGTTQGKGYYVQIPSTVGRMIKAVRARVVDDGGGETLVVGLANNVISLTFPIASPTVTDVAGATSVTSASSGFLETIVKSGLSVVMLADVTYYIFVRLGPGSTSATQRVYRVEYDWV